ncbi:polysaccharide pyruvyl transferase family protein [Wenzhouxiangella sediminis]|uniref:Polysaccharide pyruvyl transferase family protein n=1 Tax=Wenzhouxiangella sediminis TaxID=1792836 RepID=A0A3E1K4L4_9GAMM|nr:polysaccharide pyruvyl transferase family protein [Wenzhouxiangella sediminis]RFF28898.1 polysaccharide pyruvyl transferase family protein [Wenzhouxiangella sediminis]
MNYAVIGSALYGNKGASAMLETLIHGIGSLDGEARFALLSLYPPQDTERNGFESLRIVPASPIALVLAIIPLCLLHRLFKPLRPWLIRRSQTVRALHQADIYVDQCGISFNDGRLNFLIYNIAVLLPGLLMRLPVVKVAQAIGPFESRLNRLAARTFLPRLHHIFARGSITFSHIQSIGLTNVSQATDLAFAFPSIRKRHRSRTAPQEHCHSRPASVIGVAPSAVAAGKAARAGIDYVETLADFINTIVERGHQVVLFSHSARPDSEREHNNDLPLCRAIHARLSYQNGCRLVDRELDTESLRELTATFRCLVTSRFHAMVGAISEEVPCLVVGWSHKYSEVLSNFSLGDQAINYDKCQTEHLLRMFDRTLRNEPQIRSKISAQLPEVRDLAFQQIGLIYKAAVEHAANRQPT